MSIVHWGDVYMAGKKGRPLLHTRDLCGKDFDPVLVCSECGEPLVTADPRPPAPRQRRAYPLHPALKRPNLQLVTHALVHRIPFDEKRATGSSSRAAEPQSEPMRRAR
jgi:choline dehydrogenase-like flavoprotein